MKWTASDYIYSALIATCVMLIIELPKRADVKHQASIEQTKQMAEIDAMLAYIGEHNDASNTGLIEIPDMPEPVYAPIADIEALTIDRHPDVLCVALVVFGESRGESYLGQAAVAHTVWQRATEHGGDACNAAQAPSQYQFTLSADPWLIDNAAWERAVRIAEEVRSDDYDLAQCSGARYFHARHVSPSWANKREFACEVDNHVFYR
jgi:spore germination cell wall hydrolase CwlJ-like protein